jgi:dihydropteroate synthase
VDVLSRILQPERRAHEAVLMGVLNVTPDSFYDGGRHQTEAAARAAVDQLLEDGADIIDVGGESSRPGAAAVSASEQIDRVRVAIEHAVSVGATVSIDTTSPEVAEFAVGCGARIINDISCLADEGLADVAARHGAALVITHSRGPMSGMPGFSEWPDDDYGDVVDDVIAEWGAARNRAVARGVPTGHVLFDPGLGFSKNARHSLELLRRAAELRRAGAPVVLGPGRKSFIAAVDPSPPQDRLGGTVAACLAAAAAGVDVLRVHDVGVVRQALALGRALASPASPALSPPPERARA